MSRVLNRARGNGRNENASGERNVSVVDDELFDHSVPMISETRVDEAPKNFLLSTNRGG